MRNKEFKITPLKIYSWSIVCAVVIALLLAFVAIDGGVFREEKFLKALARQFYYTTIYFLLIAIVTSFIYRTWFKEFWYVNVFIICFTSGILGCMYFMVNYA